MKSPTRLPSLPFKTVLIANRGEIAIRLINACNRLHLHSIAVYTPEDRTSPHVRLATKAHALPSSPLNYANLPALLEAARATKAEAIHPGYGFLSENHEAAAAIEAAHIIWIGPHPQTIRLFGLKHQARIAATEANVPTVPGSPVVHNLSHAIDWAERLHFPILLKASAGGGGMGQAVVRCKEDMPRAYEGVVAQAGSLFSHADIFVERYIETARHIEVQIFGDGEGSCVALGLRECSMQRRRQKVVEEGGRLALTDLVTRQLRNAAVRLCETHSYRSAGTVEFVLDDDSEQWFFLEVNTRLQVEHGVTEMVSNIDIVEWMLLLAGGVPVLRQVSTPIVQTGFAIEARIYAENPVKEYVPCSGMLSEMVWPTENVCPKTGSYIRVDRWAERGTLVSSHFDPLLGKVLAWGKTRPMAILKLIEALKSTVVRGFPCNLELLLQAINHPRFLSGRYTTSLLQSFSPRTNAIEVIKPGLQTSLQDYPGRVGYWHVGVSPSGPMDAYAMGIANALVGNNPHFTALECTVTGPVLAFHTDTVVAITGGGLHGELDGGKLVPSWAPFKVSSHSILSFVKTGVKGQSTQFGAACGKITYLAVRGGFDAPKYLGSASTFPTGGFGGLNGSFLSTGDFLPIAKNESDSLDKAEEAGLAFRWPLNKLLLPHFIPKYNNESWIVAALNGPHASSHFLQDESISDIWNSYYVVHHATNRLGARLIGPTPKWTRTDGGSAGLHPSNLHDYTYAPGAVNFSGNTPIVLMLDGPSLGGFVCPITVASADHWKIAQACPGEKIKFKQVDFDQARDAVFAMEAVWEAVRSNDVESLSSLSQTWSPWWINKSEAREVPAVLARLDPATGDTAEVNVFYRMSGDEHILVEYGEIEFDFAYRLRVHMLMEELKPKPYVKELCPGVRSLLVRYDRNQIHVNDLVSVLIHLEKGVLSSIEDVVVPSRIIELPLSFEDRWTIEAQERYLRSVRPDAPYMPSNVEFVRRINGLQSTDEVRDIMTNAEYMVLGLGDVYLGAPCAIPVDPRHRIVTSKYNPARTFTPEGAVGIGGAYMCIYGMDSPGGYQLTGRTLPIWDSYGSVSEECRGAPKHVPWLLRFFDRVNFFLVTDEKLEELRNRYRNGDYKIKISEDTFSYRDYAKFCEDNKESIAMFENTRDAAYKAERERWEESGEAESDAAAKHANRNNNESGVGDGTLNDNELPAYSVPVSAGMSANVWAVHVENGQEVEKGQQLFSLESMKVEIAIEATIDGTVQRISVEKGSSVEPDDRLCIINSSPELIIGNGRCTIEYLRNLYKLGVVNPKQVISSSLERSADVEGVFTAILSDAQCEAQLETLAEHKRKKKFLPLYGIPFCVSDEIDVKGVISHSGCPELRHVASSSSLILKTLQDAGAILIGKTKVGQLNLGYTGLELGGAIPENPMYTGLISGGNGSAAVAIRCQLASFAVVIDRNGTSVLAPALCGIVGLKTSEGLLPIPSSAENFVDCISLYADKTEDIDRILQICMEARQNEKSVVRPMPISCLGPLPYEGMQLGICGRPHLTSIIGTSTESIAAYYASTEIFKLQGCRLLEVDVSSIITAADTCTASKINYIRLSKTCKTSTTLEGKLLESLSRKMSGTESCSVLDIGNAQTKLEECKRAMDISIWSSVDALVLPTPTTPCTIVEVLKSVPNASDSLGRFFQIVTCLDLCALTLQACPPYSAKSPNGIFIVAPAFKERRLLDLARHW